MLRAIMRQIESAGYATSVHRMGDYCELHAVRKPDGDGPVLIERADGESDGDLDGAACELARMTGVDLQG